MNTLKKALNLLNKQERKKANLLLLMILVMAFLDMIGVASILPFIAVLANPDIIETNVFLKEIFQISYFFGVTNTEQFLFVIGLFVFVLLITSLIFKAITTYLQISFALMLEYSIGKRLVEAYLNQSYSWFLDQHSANLGKTILSEVSQVVGNYITPLIELIAKSMVSITLISLLILIDPKLTLIASISLSATYLIIYKFTHKYLSRIGKKRLQSNQLRFTYINEAFSAIKDIKAGGLENIYTKSFSDTAQIYAKTQANSQIASQLPRYFLEAIAFGGILILVLYLMLQTGSFNNSLPIISLYVFAGYRLIPALQQIYSSAARLTFVSPSVSKLHEEIKNLQPFNLTKAQDILPFNNSIKLKNIYYNYPKQSNIALKNINISIPSKTTVGIIGPTGSGKTTMIDIILGLLQPQKGTLEVDDRVISKNNTRSWQKCIGYVPQHIFLADDTIASNIAFGQDQKEINYVNLENAARISNLHEFIINKLPKQYQTKIGERGVKLSGGERQRIGIARAIYHNPKLLILDEATSSLDNQTEQTVMEAVNNLNKEMTIIIIAHRLNTLKDCDVIFKLINGEVVAQGKFEELIENNKKIIKV
jgi:ABC-type multidrug transport system fused ATPase/permease subunit